MKTIAIERRDAETDRLKEVFPHVPWLWEEVAAGNGGLSADDVQRLFDLGLNVWTVSNRYVPVREQSRN